MGIKNLKKFLRESYPSLLKQIHISQFRDEKIAVDISSFIYKYKVVFGDRWISSFPSLFCCFKENGVHATFIFDGKPPPEKEGEKQKRKVQKQSIEDNVTTLKLDLEMYKDTRKSTPLLTDVMKKITKNNQNLIKINRLLHSGGSGGGENEIHIDVDAIEQYIEKKEKQIVNITSYDNQSIQTMLDRFGIPYIQAPGEAEALASYLYSKDMIKAVVTEDTDILAYGTGIFLSNLNTSSGVCDVLYLNDILQRMNLSRQEFLDFCIMCGTDYNENIRDIGCKKVYKIISTYKSIEAFIDEEKKKPNAVDFMVLNHTRVREIFHTFGDLENKDEYKVSFWNHMIDIEELLIFLRSRGCRISRTIIEELWKEVEIQFED